MTTPTTLYAPTIPGWQFCRPGDILLYDMPGLMGWLIKTKTWSDVAHVELYLNNGVTFTARPKGVRVYAGTLKDLRYVLRPRAPFDLNACLTWMATPVPVGGGRVLAPNQQGYDYWGLLLSFVARRQGRTNDKMFCSEACTHAARAGGVEPFTPETHADEVAPSTFAYTPAYTTVYAYRKAQKGA